MKTPRHLLAATVLAAGSLFLSSCDKPAEPASPAAESTPASPSASAAPGDSASAPAANAPADDDAVKDTGEPKVLNLFCWSEYVPQSVIDAFTKQTGIRVNVENYSSNEEMYAKLLSGGQYDLIQPSEYAIEALIEADQLRPLEKSEIPNIKNIDPEFLDMPFDPGNKYSVPWMAGPIGIIVNTELVQDDIKGYKDVFQEKFRDKIVILDDAREIVSWAFETLNIPINDVTDENLEKARGVLEQWLPLVKVYDSDSPKTSLLNGDVALGIVWNGEGALLTAEDEKFKWIVPEEGTHIFVDNLAIPKNAEHPKNAELFINFILRPKISKLISDEFPYLNPNLAARQLLDEEALANPASYPSKEELDRMTTFKNIGDKASDIDDLVTTIKVQ